MSSPRILHGERSRIAREGLVGRMGRSRERLVDVPAPSTSGSDPAGTGRRRDRERSTGRLRGPDRRVTESGNGPELLPAPGRRSSAYDVEYDVEVEVTRNAAPEGPRLRVAGSSRSRPGGDDRIPPPHLGGEEAQRDRPVPFESPRPNSMAGTSGRLVLRLPATTPLNSTPVVKVGCTSSTPPSSRSRSAPTAVPPGADETRGPRRFVPRGGREHPADPRCRGPTGSNRPDRRRVGPRPHRLDDARRACSWTWSTSRITTANSIGSSCASLFEIPIHQEKLLDDDRHALGTLDRFFAAVVVALAGVRPPHPGRCCRRCGHI